MRHRVIQKSIWLLFVTIMLGCKPDEEALKATIQQEVSQIIPATISVYPTWTSQPTLTPLSTIPNAPSYTPAPTYTEAPTYTPLPTYTQLPTLTLIPTDIPTATPTASPTRLASSTASTSSSSTTSNDNSDIKMFLAQKIHELINNVNTFWSLVPPSCVVYGFNQGHYQCMALNEEANCPAVVQAYDTIAGVRNLNFNSSDLHVQNTYAIYQSAIDEFTTSQGEWVNACRNALATGEVIKITRQKSNGELIPVLRNIINTLTQARESLLAPTS